MNAHEPRTLQEAVVHFSNQDNCVAYMASRRWPDGVVACPTCGRTDVSYIAKRRVWQCKTRHAKCQFSVKVGTIMEDSPIGLDKWLMTMWMIANCKNGVSSYEISRAINVTQKSTWFMLHRIRLAMTDETDKIGVVGGGPVECDETFIGGKMKNMHKDKRPKVSSAGGATKAIVLGMLERGGRVKAMVVSDRKKQQLDPAMAASINPYSHIITDEHVSYGFLSTPYFREVINHAEEYVNGHIHTNGIENFWTLLKRTLSGTYISVEPFHLDAYVKEQVFRFNNRVKVTDAQRMGRVIDNAKCRRLTYAELTAKPGATPRPF